MNSKALNEAELPTLRDLAEAVRKFVDLGLGDHPMQIVVVPDSTLQSISRVMQMDMPEELRPGDKPALMIEQDGVAFISMDYLDRKAGRKIGAVISH